MFLARANRIDNGQEVIGWLFWNKFIMIDKSDEEKIEICGEIHEKRFDFGSGNPDCEFYEIDPSTLSFNEKNMIDMNGNKIFAAINKNGKGGDMLHYYNGNYNNVTYLAVYLNGGFYFVNKDNLFFSGNIKPEISKDFFIIGKNNL